MASTMNQIHKETFRRAKLQVALLDYLADHPHRKVSAAELANVFQVNQITVRNCLLLYLKDGVIGIEHELIDIFYWLKNEVGGEENDLNS